MTASKPTIAEIMERKCRLITQRGARTEDDVTDDDGEEVVDEISEAYPNLSTAEIIDAIDAYLRSHRH